MTDPGTLYQAGPQGIDTGGDLSSFVDVILWRAKHQSHVNAFTFLENGVDETCAMTYAQLSDAARRMAGRLQDLELEGERVLLLYPSGPDYVIALIACLFSGVVAVPFYPPVPGRRCSILESVLHDAQPRAVLTTPRELEVLTGRLGKTLADLDCELLAPDLTGDELDSHWQRPSLQRDSIAYVQYTSGSTLDPKGVLLTHGNLSHNCRLISKVIGASETDLTVSWLPFFHDMGLVGGLLFPIYSGAPLVFMPPEAFVMKPVRWLQAISRYGARLSPAPNFAFDLCVQRTRPQERADLDLSTWRVAFNGSERIDHRSLQRFSKTFHGHGFRYETFLPCYGLAESTLMVTGGCALEEPVVRRYERAALDAGRASLDDEGVTLVGCGRAHGDLRVLIVDPETCRRCPSGTIGEIWVSGPSVTAGYWNRPQLTRDIFEARESESGSGPFLRTGDLGFQQDGEIFVTGRLKDLMIVGGRNIHPEDIEATVEAAHPEMSPHGAIAFSVDGNPQERLVVVAEIGRGARQDSQLGQLEQVIRAAVAKENNVAVSEVVFVRRRTLPKTTSGKKRRSACRRSFVDGQLEAL